MDEVIYGVVSGSICILNHEQVGRYVEDSLLGMEFLDLAADSGSKVSLAYAG